MYGGLRFDFLSPPPFVQGTNILDVLKSQVKSAALRAL
jgi:hypothetical protein